MEIISYLKKLFNHTYFIIFILIKYSYNFLNKYTHLDKIIRHSLLILKCKNIYFNYSRTLT